MKPNTCVPPEIAKDLKEKLLKGEIGVDQIAKMLPEEKLALKALLEDFVTEELGVAVKEEEVKIINEKSAKIDEAQKALGTDLGNPLKPKENLAFFEAKKSMDDYLNSITPASKLKVLTGTIGRGMMLASVKSPLLNIASNIEIGFTETLSRRIATGQFRGSDSSLAIDFVKMANQIYQKTGYDISRMTQLSDSGVAGARVLGDTVHTQGPGAIRKTARVVEDIVFKQLMGAPDVAFSSATFADSVNTQSLAMADGNTVRGREIMEDAMRLEPLTPEGETVRAQGIMDAQKATWTDDTWASKVSMGIRKIFNNVSGDLRIGDYLFPFVKTPANIIATGMDYAGLGIPKALVKTVNAVRTGEFATPEYFRSITRDLVRSGLGLTGAFAIASQLDDDDFVGAYDPARAQIEELRNSNTNSIRIGGKWVSVDWLGPLSVPVTAMMYARKYGDKAPEEVFQYGKGVFSSALNIPGVADIYDFVRSNAFKDNQTLEEMGGETVNYLTKEVYSRLVPSIISDIANATDKYQRVTGKGIEGIKAKIPVLRKTLPIKQNIFGEKIKGESPVVDILFGSRVKTDKENAVIGELNQVSQDTGKGITFTNFDKSSAKAIAAFKKEVGQMKFDRAKTEYGKLLKEKLTQTMSKSGYKNLSPEEKLKIINGLDAEVQDSIFSKYGFKYKPVKTKKVSI